MKIDVITVKVGWLMGKGRMLRKNDMVMTSCKQIRCEPSCLINMNGKVSKELVSSIIVKKRYKG